MEKTIYFYKLCHLHPLVSRASPFCYSFFLSFKLWILFFGPKVNRIGLTMILGFVTQYHHCSLKRAKMFLCVCFKIFFVCFNNLIKHLWIHHQTGVDIISLYGLPSHFSACSSQAQYSDSCVVILPFLLLLPPSIPSFLFFLYSYFHREFFMCCLHQFSFIF